MADFLIMQVPKDEIPNIEHIRDLASIGLPPHYQLKSVECVYGSDCPQVIPEDWDIIVTYENHLDERLQGTFEDIDAHHRWADALIQDIRSEWPAESIRITFSQREPGVGRSP